MTKYIAIAAIAGIGLFGLTGCAQTSAAFDKVSNYVKSSKVVQTLDKYNEGTPCSAFRYNDFDC